ncbi:MAG: carboxylating nicotinate-nucleotide diphosphorylase [Gammaproteobacteria bacterium]|nr:carboxylating nicotinate-nucleotide diphosphorylase [Gammaproteobacteria bacterium]NNF60226.1 carboxylating nicotinate-nucleotide diphosphorylase [Gammaproteobacteria bacterium]NNM20334.1 carboxylating nicotinate-nucleotide diphosphorylase [Gammaproteobacteria bacterium]
MPYNRAAMSDYEATIYDNVESALAEDVGSGDLTASLVDESATAVARVVCREPAVLCGQPWFDAVFREIDAATGINWQARDGDRIDADMIVCHIEGRARSILTAERCALNFLQTLSGTATAARAYADAVAGTGATILDTRKTLPGLRLAQKYAVRCGGGHNHRMGLYDAILIKENHICSAGGIAAAVQKAREQHPDVPVEVEIESPDQLDEALATTTDVIMLDNFSLQQMREAVTQNRSAARPVRLEASGNVSLETVREIAATGVDFVSVGGLTKHVQATDYSLQFEQQPD